MFKVIGFICDIFRPDSEKIRWLFSQDALIFAGLGIGLSFLLKSSIPALLVTGPIVGSQLFLLAIEAGNRLYKMFTQNKLSNLPAATPLISVSSPNPTPSMPVLGPRHRPRIDSLNLTKEVRELLKDPKNDYLLTENNNLFLRDAAEKNNWELVGRLLKKSNVAAQAHCGDWLVLRLAIQHNQWEIVSKFLTLSILTNTPMTVEKIGVLNRLIHKVTIQNQANIMNQIIHCPVYDLFNGQTKFNFLLFCIKHNIYSAIIKSLSDSELLEALSFENFNTLFKDMPDNHIEKISTQCNFFLAYIKEKYSNLSFTINNLNIHHLINVESFDSLENIALFHKNPLLFLESKTQNTPHIIIAMRLLHAKNNYLRLTNARQNAGEGAQQASEVIIANQLFETVKHHYQKTFDNKKTIEYSSVEVIEREIKAYLLEQILSEAHENIKNLKDIKGSTKIINIIDLHKEDLLDGEMHAHLILVRAFNKHFIPDNVSSAQTAWFSYSALHDIDRNNWKFLVHPTEEAVVHSTAESALVANQRMTNTMASSIIRERIAYYWLAVTDKNYPDEDNFRLGNFVGAISTIYKTNGFGQSCCYPGHLTGIAQMGLNHPIAEPITLDNLIEQAIVAPVIQATKDILEEHHPYWSAEEKENFLSCITFINEKNAAELFHSVNPPPIDMEMYQTFSKHHSFIVDSAFDVILKNQRYQNRRVSVQEREEIKKGIEYKLLAMASNQHIVSALNDVILASPCIRKDINLAEASPFVPGSHKHQLYLVLAKELNAKLLSLSKKNLPSILGLNKIGGELSTQIINDVIADIHPTTALEELKTFGLFFIDITELKFLNNANKPATAILTQFNSQKSAAHTTKSQDTAQNENSQNNVPTQKLKPEFQLFP